MERHPETTGGLEQLVLRIAALEERVAALEHPSGVKAPIEDVEALRAKEIKRAEEVVSEPSEGGLFAGAFPVVGSALLGIAGAYLLRAVSGADLVPRGVVAAAAAVYASAWLVAAERAASRRFAAALYAATSILILAPMLWEVSIRFQAMPAGIVTIILAAYAGIAAVTGRSVERRLAFSIAFAGAAVTAVALSVGTHHIVPFAAILLAMMGVGEWVLASGCPGSVRALVALCADFVIWTLIFIYRLPVEERTDYPSVPLTLIVGAVVVLFGLTVASVVLRTAGRAQPITAFQTVQALIGLALYIFAMVWLVPAQAQAAIGILCLALAGTCTVAAYGRFRRDTQLRNFRVFAGLGSVLFVGAVFVLAPSSLTAAIFGVAGMGAVLLGDRVRALSLELQGGLYLCIAAGVSGLAVYVSSALAGSMPAKPGWLLFMVAGCVVIAYVAANERPGEDLQRQALHLLPALLAAGIVTALLVRGAVGLAANWINLDVFHVALLRTIALCAIAVALAWGGARLGRAQMVHVAYGALAFLAAKLFFEDLRHGHMEFIAGSIFLVALTFIGVPRLVRRGSASAART